MEPASYMKHEVIMKSSQDKYFAFSAVKTCRNVSWSWTTERP